MRKIKITSLILTCMVYMSTISAQSIEDGKRFLNYERFNSAKNVFSSLVNANPNNAEAVYWLGQTLIATEDAAGARALYQKGLQSNPNAPLIMVGMGHVLLLSNSANDARNMFETAISLTKGKDATVLNAIGRANIDAKNGDIAYAIDKLKLAADRDKKSAEIYVNLGDAYRKMTDGANAQLAYQSALALDSRDARASYMIGRIYQTQGISQEPIYMNYYNNAISEDPNFAPVFGWLYEYYYQRDVNKSRDYLNKYIAVADQDNKNCYYQAAILYASNQFQQSISRANECITAGANNVFPNLYGLIAYASNRLGDSVNAKKYFETYFAKQKPDKIGPNDLDTYAKVLLKFPGNEALAASYSEKALALDTLEADKIEHIKGIASSFVASKNYNAAGDWYSRILGVKKNYGKVDLYNAGWNYYKGSRYHSSDSVFGLYTQKYPEDIFGWYMRARSSEGIDSTEKLGMAKPFYEKVIQYGLLDTAKNKEQIIKAYNYMIAYNYNILKDNNAAFEYNKKILLLDPTNALAIQNAEALNPNRKVKIKSNNGSGEKPKELKVKVKDKKKK